MLASLKHPTETYSRSKKSFRINAVSKEIKSIGVAFDMLENRKVAPVGFKITSGHATFDAKMDFTRKAR